MSEFQAVYSHGTPCYYCNIGVPFYDPQTPRNNTQNSVEKEKLTFSVESILSRSYSPRNTKLSDGDCLDQEESHNLSQVQQSSALTSSENTDAALRVNDVKMLGGKSFIFRRQNPIMCSLLSKLTFACILTDYSARNSDTSQKAPS